MFGSRERPCYVHRHLTSARKKPQAPGLCVVASRVRCGRASGGLGCWVPHRYVVSEPRTIRVGPYPPASGQGNHRVRERWRAGTGWNDVLRDVDGVTSDVCPPENRERCGWRAPQYCRGRDHIPCTGGVGACLYSAGAHVLCRDHQTAAHRPACSAREAGEGLRPRGPPAATSRTASPGDTASTQRYDNRSSGTLRSVVTSAARSGVSGKACTSYARSSRAVASASRRPGRI